MTSITYDSVQLQNTTYIPRTVSQESAPPRLLNLIKLARQDGSIVIDDTFGEKYIEIPGILKGTSVADLEQKIDAFKELISRKDKNLDIDFAGGTRRYICRSVSHEFNRDFFHLLYVPYTVKFFVIGSLGMDTAETHFITQSGITATTTTKTYTFAGSYPPKPRHVIGINTRGNADVIRIENTATGAFIDVDLDDPSLGIFQITVDEDKQTVLDTYTGNLTPLNYRGRFPSVFLGSVQSLKLTVIGSGSTVDQQQTANHGGSRAVLGGGWTSQSWQAQSFILNQSGRLHKLSLKVDKTTSGSLTGVMQFIILADDNGKPGAILGGGLGYEITLANVPTSAAFTDAVWAGTTFNKPFLKAGRTYWIVMNPGVDSGSDINNFFGWWFDDTAASYTKGKMMFRKSTNDPWQAGYASAQVSQGGFLSPGNMTFIAYLGADGGSASFNVSWDGYYTPKYL